MSTGKRDRLNLRIEPELGELFEAALADRTDFSINKEQWKAFMDVLDRSPRDIPRLRRLLSESSVLEPRE